MNYCDYQGMILYVAWQRFKIVMSEQAEIVDIKKKVISTGIRVGTQVKTKFMKPFITKASPEGLYMLDIDITLEKIRYIS